jgi:DDE superfamily endonuclease
VWAETQPFLDVEKLVFIDETWLSTDMTRRYGRAPQGQRCHASAPRGHWQTSTFVGALRHNRVDAPMVTDGPIDGEIFLAWVQQALCPTLQPGDIVILDNLSSHKVKGVREAIATAGATLRCSISRPTLPTSIPSKNFLPNSKHCSAKPLRAPSKPSGSTSPKPSIPSLPPNALIISLLPDTSTLNLKML